MIPTYTTSAAVLSPKGPQSIQRIPAAIHTLLRMEKLYASKKKKNTTQEDTDDLSTAASPSTENNPPDGQMDIFNSFSSSAVI